MSAPGTIFANSDTLCSREHNSCKRRTKCKRHEDPRNETQWEADYWNNFGRFCEHFIAIPKTDNE